MVFGFADEDEIESARTWVTKEILRTIRQQFKDEADNYVGLDPDQDPAVARWLCMRRYPGQRGKMQKIMSGIYAYEFLSAKDEPEVIEGWWNELIAWVQDFDEQRKEFSSTSTGLLTKLYWGAWLGIDERRKDLGAEVPGFKTIEKILDSKKAGMNYSKFGSRHEYSIEKD